MFSLRRPHAPSPSLSLGAKWRLLEMVYAQQQLLWTNAAAIVFVGLMCWYKTGSLLPLAWMSVGVVLATLRLADFHAFARHRLTESQDRIERRFVRGAWMVAALWGSASYVILLTGEQVANLLTLSVEAAFLATALAHNNPVERAATGTLRLVLASLVLALLAHPDPSVKLCAAAVLVYLASASRTVRHLHRQSVRLIVADDDNAALVRSVRSVNAELEAANRRLGAMAATDGLTGMANRRGFDVRLAEEWRRTEAAQTGMALMLLDIDHFKAYNDRYGHLAGDECLRRVALCIERSIRSPDDFAARYGGEEFVVILPQTEEPAALVAAERIRAAVEDMRLPGPFADEDVVTVSIGVAAMLTGARGLARQADRAGRPAPVRGQARGPQLGLRRGPRQGRGHVRATRGGAVLNGEASLAAEP